MSNAITTPFDQTQNQSPKQVKTGKNTQSPARTNNNAKAGNMHNQMFSKQADSNTWLNDSKNLGTNFNSDQKTSSLNNRQSTQADKNENDYKDNKPLSSQDDDLNPVDSDKNGIENNGKYGKSANGLLNSDKSAQPDPNAKADKQKGEDNQQKAKDSEAQGKQAASEGQQIAQKGQTQAKDLQALSHKTHSNSNTAPAKHLKATGSKMTQHSSKSKLPKKIQAKLKAAGHKAQHTAQHNQKQFDQNQQHATTLKNAGDQLHQSGQSNISSGQSKIGDGLGQIAGGSATVASGVAMLADPFTIAAGLAAIAKGTVQIVQGATTCGQGHDQNTQGQQQEEQGTQKMDQAGQLHHKNEHLMKQTQHADSQARKELQELQNASGNGNGGSTNQMTMMPALSGAGNPFGGIGLK